MKRLVKKGIVFLSIIGFLAGVMPAYGFDRGQGGGACEGKKFDHKKAYKQRQKMMDNLIGELEITPKQEKVLKKQRAQNRKQMKTLKTTMREKRNELRKELEKNDSNEDRIYRIASQVKGLHGRLIDARIQSVLTIKKILTPEQYKSFREKLKTVKGKFRKRGHGKKGSYGG